MKLAIWNVNSIKVRQEHVLHWLRDKTPDLLMLQELKGEVFPEDIFREAGYESVFVPQKGRNGVAVLSGNPVEVVRRELPGDKDDTEARYLEADYAGIRVINIYAPNGNPPGSDNYAYKLRWLDRLTSHLKSLRREQIPFLVGGDFNIIPEEQDCHDPDSWRKDALFQPEARERYRKLVNLGLCDALRALHPEERIFTFWDYQGGAFRANAGIRIDHFLLSPALSDRLQSCTADIDPRSWDKPSDHIPVILELSE